MNVLGEAILLLMNGARAVLESLKKEGVDVVFGYPGGAVLTLYDELYKMKFPHIETKHEQGAVHAADGYARATGKVGVVFATSGPGGTNLVTGIATAYMDSIPLVCFTGQVGNPYIGKDSFQEADICGITTPITKYNYLVKNVKDLPRTIKEAFFIARTGRPGPVVIDIAKDVFAAEVNFEYPKEVHRRGYTGDFTGNEKQIDAVVGALRQAKRPLFFLGGGVTLANVSDDVRAIIKRVGAPVVSTLMGLGCADPTDDASFGMAGMHGSYAANMSIQECDLLIGIGLRFDDRVTGNLATYAKQAKIIHFDIDPAEFNKNVTVDLAVLGNCKETLPAVTKLMDQAQHTSWIEGFKPYEEKEYTKVIDKALHPTEGPLLMGEVIRKVSEAAHNEGIMVTDVGQNQLMACRYFKFTKERSVVTSGGLGTMGYGLPAAIGATFGAPDRTVCLFVGDGGLQMTIQELGTIMEQGAPVKIILLNNNFLGNVRQWQEMFFAHRYSFTPMQNPDYELIAKGYGIPAKTVIERADLDAAIAEMLATPGPYLLQCAIKEEDNVLPMTPPGANIDEMLLEI